MNEEPEEVDIVVVLCGVLSEMRDVLFEIRDMMQSALEHVVEEAVIEEAAELNKAPRES